MKMKTTWQRWYRSKPALSWLNSIYIFLSSTNLFPSRIIEDLHPGNVASARTGRIGSGQGQKRCGSGQTLKHVPKANSVCRTQAASGWGCSKGNSVHWLTTSAAVPIATADWRAVQSGLSFCICTDAVFSADCVPAVNRSMQWTRFSTSQSPGQFA